MTVDKLHFRPGQHIQIVYYNEEIDEGYYIRHTPAQLQYFTKDGMTHSVQLNAVKDIMKV